MEDRYTYFPGSFIPGATRKLFWVKKTFGSINQWKTGPSSSYFSDLVSRVTATIVLRKWELFIGTQLTPLAAALNRIVCACIGNSVGNGTNGTCFPGILPTPIGQLFVIPKSSTTLDINGVGTVDVCDTCTSGDSYGLVAVSQVFPSSVISPTTSKRSVEEAHGKYSVVINDSPSTTGVSGRPAGGSTVGQIVGNGMQISVSNSNVGTQVSLVIRSDIEIENENYTLAIFAQTANGEIIVEDCGVVMSGEKMKCTLYKSGTFFPAMVRSDWMTYSDPSSTISSRSSSGWSTSSTGLSTTSSGSVASVSPILGVFVFILTILTCLKL